MMATSKGPGLYEFLIEAELQQYYAGFKNDLKVQNVPQLKYVTEDDLLSIGMSKPEMRRLKKFFQRHFPQNYLSKFKKLILSRRDENHESSLSVANEEPEKPAVKVPNKHIIPAEAIVVNKELGQGEFGTVQQGVWTDGDNRIQVAIKCLSRERMQNNPIEFLKEAAIMYGIDHEHIVRLYGVVLDTNSFMLVTELAPLRSLLECLKEPSLRSNFPVLSLCDFAIQVCDGMQYLEQKRLIHRDLAARNILVFSKNKVKISDFGLSRALGVGKDYYQTNFNVNLKLPIAWCAPECISYLKFTSASDVWAFGVTLWEMFSYGFQPWAALTGHQILEAIDEPNFQRLEQPECCPREYFNIMMKCWQHDPNTRPRFSDLIQLLPECKPEQVQAVQEFVEDPTKSRRDQLVYRVGDIITVLDKQQQTSSWKGVTNSGKTGWFNPAHTVTYLGNNLPSNNLGFTRGDGKNVYSSKRKIRPDMISGPQGDFKHTGHVGFDGAYFGDLSFLGGKNPNLPRQIVTPYKPHEDSSSSGVYSNHTENSRNCSDVSDCTPLLKTQPPESIWAEANKANTSHEYHEISDDEELGGSPIFKSSGPSLMDEMESVLRSLGSSPTPPLPNERKKPPPPFSLPLGSSFSTPPASPLAEAINVKNELKEMAVKAARRKKQATVKPISAEDEKTLDLAIARATELTAKSMNNIDGCTPPESPHTPASPSKRKFSFRFPSVQKHNSPKPERKNFSEQTACIPDIQALCDKLRLKTLSPTPTPPGSPRPYAVSLRGSYSSLSKDSSPQASPFHRSSLGNFRSAFECDPPKTMYGDSFRNGVVRNNHVERNAHVKLPLWDQASAEFYFARSRDLLTKAMSPSLGSGSHLRGSHETIGAGADGRQSFVKSMKEFKRPATQILDGRWTRDGDLEFSGLKNGESLDGDYKLTQKSTANSVPSACKEVPLIGETSHHLMSTPVTLRKCGAKGHMRRRSYNGRYISSSSSDSMDDSDGEKQMNHRLKMRKQRRGGSFSSINGNHPTQFLMNSPPPQNSFLNSITSPKNNSGKGKFYFGNVKPFKTGFEGIQQHRPFCDPTPKANGSNRSSGVLDGDKWGLMIDGGSLGPAERPRDSPSLTFTSSNSSSLNWEEYLEADRDFLSFNNNCPPSPAPQSTISPEAKEVYSSLVEQPAMEAQIILPVSGVQGNLSRGSHHSSSFRPGGLASSVQSDDVSASDGTESNPLRMLRTGAFPIVRPKGKLSRPAEKIVRAPTSSIVNGSSSHVEEESSQTLIPSGVAASGEEERWRKNSTSSGTSLRKDSTASSQGGIEEDNPIPLPPRDRSKPSLSNKPRHQRKHPLVIPQGNCESTADKYDDVFHPSCGPSSGVGTATASTTAAPIPYTRILPPVHPSHHSTTPKAHEVDDSFDQQIATELDALDDINTDADVSEAESPTVTTHDSPRTRRGLVVANAEVVPQLQHPSEHFLNRRLKRRDEDFELANGSVPTKPNLRLKQKIAQLNQTATMYGAGEEGFGEDLFGTRPATDSRKQNGEKENGRKPAEEDEERRTSEEGMWRREDHVSCEDLLEFSTKSQSKSRGEDSDEVRLMSKVLGKEMSSENCLKALNATHWDVYGAIKLAKLQNLLKNSGAFQNISSCWDALVACDGDVVKAASVLITQGSPPDCV